MRPSPPFSPAPGRSSQPRVRPSYAVCQHYGLDTSDYSFGYVAGWSSGKELSELKASLETIRATANALMDFAERDGKRLGNGERRLIVDYANVIRDYHKVATLPLVPFPPSSVLIERIGTLKLCAKGRHFRKKAQKIETALHRCKAAPICFR